MTMAGLVSLKGGTGKTLLAFELASILSLRSEVVLLSLDSNRSGHDRFVQHHHREVPEAEGLAWDPDDRIWPHDRRLNHLLLKDPSTSPDVEGRYLYRRDDLPNLGVLFHETGTLTTLAALTQQMQVRGRLRRLLDHLKDTYDWVIVDLAPSFENALVGGVISRCDMVLPTTNLTGDGLVSVKEAFATLITDPVEIHGVAVTPYHRRNVGSARRTEQGLIEFTERYDLDLLRVSQDATVGRAQEATTPLILHRPEHMTLKSGVHPYDRDPPKALADLQEIAWWLEDLAEQPEQRAAAWAARQEAWQRRREQAMAEGAGGVARGA